MVLNLRPGELTLLDCVVEECDERFSQEKQNEMLNIISDVLGTRDNGVHKENGEAVEEDGG